MRKLLLIAVFCLFSTPATVFACSCLTGEPAYEFNRARLVFIGRMLGGTEKIQVGIRSGNPRTVEAGKVRFAVEEVFKGKAETSIKTDDQGRFRIEGFTGETYWLEARGRKEGKKQGEEIEMHSLARKISMRESLKNVRLTLSKDGYFGEGCK